MCEHLASKAQDTLPEAERETDVDQDFPRLSLREYVEEAFPLLANAPRFIPNWHIDAICEHLEACSKKQILNLIINLPPGFMKSVLCGVAWPSWEWTERPSTQFLCGTYHDNLSTRDSLACRTLIESPWYQARWGKRFRIRYGANEKRLFHNSRQGFRQATTVAKGFATGAHVDICLIDDPIDVMRARNKLAQEEAIKWYDGGISGRGNVPELYVRVVVHQRLARNDLTGHLLEMGGWEHLIIPMHYDPKRSKVTSLGWKDPRTKEGELAWPELFPEKVVQKLRKALNGASDIACQHEQKTLDSEGKMFNERILCWAEWNQDPALERELLGKDRKPGSVRGVFILHRKNPDDGDEADDREETEPTVERVLACDCTFAETYDTALKDGKDNDYTAGFVGAITPNYDLLAFHVVRRKLKVPDQADFINDQRSQFPFTSWDGVESKASGIGLIQLFDKSGRPLRELKADHEKKQRALGLATLCKRRKFFILSGTAWSTDFVTELLEFDEGDHDDMVDAAAHMANEMMNPAHLGPRARKL